VLCDRHWALRRAGQRLARLLLLLLLLLLLRRNRDRRRPGRLCRLAAGPPRPAAAAPRAAGAARAALAAIVAARQAVRHLLACQARRVHRALHQPLRRDALVSRLGQRPVELRDLAPRPPRDAVAPARPLQRRRADPEVGGRLLEPQAELRLEVVKRELPPRARVPRAAGRAAAAAGAAGGAVVAVAAGVAVGQILIGVVVILGAV
jgi:hypothetical protein